MNIESLTAERVMSRILVAVKADESPLMAIWRPPGRVVRRNSRTAR
ncbi:hypothetical protein [Nonomuraea sp. NPDC049141]